MLFFPWETISTPGEVWRLSSRSSSSSEHLPGSSSSSKGGAQNWKQYCSCGLGKFETPSLCYLYTVANFPIRQCHFKTSLLSHVYYFNQREYSVSATSMSVDLSGSLLTLMTNNWFVPWVISQLWNHVFLILCLLV